MAELATIARPYAEALFKASKGELDSVAQWLETLAAVASNAQLLQFADNPKVSDEQLFYVIAGVAKVPLPEAAKNFLRTVIQNDRLTVLPEIAAQFRALKNSQRGSADAVVYSAYPIDANVLQVVAMALEKRFARKLNITVQIDPSLIGGIRVVVGDEVMDTSVKAHLEQMRAALKS